MVPQNYIKLKKQRASKEVLLDFVRQICLEALEEEAKLKNLPLPEFVDEDLVTMTYNMYEHTLSKRGS